jgi:hypothetical protein
MGRSLIKYLSFLLFAGAGLLRAQIPDDVKLTIERYLETLETNADYTQVYEDLIQFTEKPVNLNHAAVDEMMNFPLITPVQAAAIVNHRQRFGMFIQLAELQVLGFEPEQIRAVAPFVSILPGASDRLKNLAGQLQMGKTEVIITGKRRYPDDKEVFTSDRMALSTRLRYTLPGVFSFGVTAEKDPGEMWWNKGPDYYSAHAAVFNLGAIKTAVLGDYVMSLGQGLVLGSGIGIGKSANVLNIKRSQPAIKAYRGVNEFLFHRGASATVLLGKRLELMAAISSSGISARLADTSVFGSNSFSSVDLDGLHRTADEIATKSNLRRGMQGVWLNYNGRKGNLGGGVSIFNYNLAPGKSDDLYKLYNPTTSQQHFYHAWQGHTIGRLHVFSEWAWLAETRKHAVAVGALVSMGKWAELSVHLRDYAPGFISPYATSFGNAAQNERGCYMGLKFNVNKKLSISNYVDVWQQPWLTFRLYAPSRNQELLWQMDYAATKKTQVYLRYRHVVRAIQTTAGSAKAVTDYTINMVRVNLAAAVTQHGRVELRAEHSLNMNGPDAGHSQLFYAEYTTRYQPARLQLVMRYSMFDVSGYYNRIYAYENQLLYDFGTVAFYGKGRSAYALVTKSLNKKLKAGLRYGWMESINNPGEAAVWNRRIFAQLIWKI